jgi:Mn2+/Fe2+ NRAMP family transporter
MIAHNMLTCEGLGTNILGDCSLSWISFAIIVFLAMIARRQAQDGVLSGMGYNQIGAFALGLGANIVVTFLTGSARWSLIAGVAGIAIGGFLLGMIMPSEGGGDDYGI